MAATFRPVNTPMAMAIDVKKDDDEVARSPTTPTPTKATFGQRPLPTSPFPQAVQIPESIEEKHTPRSTPKRENSQHSRKSRGGSEDVDMDESDGENQDDGASDDESVNGDGTKSNKKKKSQRFYCTDYPPCNLSFTRSEHLARHIRYCSAPLFSFWNFFIPKYHTNNSIGNTPESDHSNVIVRGDFHVWITCDSMRRRYT